MNWNNVKLILAREIRDQLRDRRTLFMIAVLPLLLYPLLGTSFFQITQFLREHPVHVLIVGAPQAEDLPPLVEKDHFAADLFDSEKAARLLLVNEQSSLADAEQPADSVQPANAAQPSGPGQSADADLRERARQLLRRGKFDVVVYFPPEFSQQLADFRHSLAQPRDQAAPPTDAESPVGSVDIFSDLAKDASRVAHRRVDEVIERRRDEIGKRNLRDSRINAAAAKPFKIASEDIAHESQHTAALWSKILPFVLVLWALTGAFYPAIDLCAGEKERGTLETLLSSPAERLEIVWGKLLTVMVFSMATAVLNLASMAVTGSFILSQLPNFGPPPTAAFLWLLVALVPMAALFSALCLALAAFARSTKEGQYYLMPLVLVTMPLTILPMAPGVELNLGTALIPVTGVVVLLRSLLEGNYLSVLPYVPLVAAVTLACCWLAIRWATEQFNSEAVLFRESERWDVSIWLKHLLRDREATPSFAEAMFCGVLILLIRFFMNFALPAPHSFNDFVMLVCVTQLAVVLTPALLMSVVLTTNPAQSLLLRRPPLAALVAAPVLALVLHPLMNWLQSAVVRVYPISPEIADALQSINLGEGNLWITLAVIAVVPALCEELAFRGFILSGMRHLGHKWTAIILSSVFFAATHAIFQQSLLACLAGMVIGYIAIQTGSLFPGILFHMVHNSIAVLLERLAPAQLDDAHWLHFLMRNAEGEESLYTWPVVTLSVVVSAAILFWFHKLPYARTPEESLQEAIEHQSAHWQPG